MTWQKRRWECLFQSTPPQRGRRAFPTTCPPNIHFNPRPHKGGRHAPVSSISIHKNFNPRPTKGATSEDYMTYVERNISIHAPTKGGRQFDGAGVSYCKQFQSTPPTKGGDLYCFRPAASTLNFNPRPHKGGDYDFVVIPIHILLFQSTPPQGGRTGF